MGGLFAGTDDEPWRYVTTLFVHDNLGYAFVTLVAVGVFGTMIERRFGWFSVLAVFLLSGIAGAAAAAAVDVGPLLESAPLHPVLGANGAALGLLAAWLTEDRRAARAGEDRGNDLMGVYVFAAVLLLLPLAVVEANVVAGLVGAAAGALLGFVAAGLHPSLSVSELPFTDEQIDRAVEALSDPERFREAEARVARMAPQLQRILNEALHERRLVRRGARVAGAPRGRGG